MPLPLILKFYLLNQRRSMKKFKLVSNISLLFLMFFRVLFLRFCQEVMDSMEDIEAVTACDPFWFPDAMISMISIRCLMM